MNRNDKLFVLLVLITTTIISGIVLCQEANAVTNAANDIELGKNWRLSWVDLSFGAMVQASNSEEAQLEAQPFIGAGPSFVLMRKGIYGVSLSSLFYMNADKTLSPLLAGGLVLFPGNRVAISLGWDFGKISGTLKNSWQERLKLLINYSLDILK